MNMPGGKGYGPFDEEHKYDYYGRNNSYWSNLEKYVKEGKVDEKRINEAAKRVLAPMYKLNQMENYPKVDIYKPTNTQARKNLQRRAATESQVLLKNDGILPLKKGKYKKIAVIGNDALDRDCVPSGLPQCLNETNEVINGHVPLGYGSGVTNFEYLVYPLQGIKDVAKEYDMEVVSSGKMKFINESINSTHVKYVDAEEDIEGGVKVANESDVAIVFVKATSGEEFVAIKQSIGDRRDLDVWYKGNELIDKVCEVNDNVIVVINAPATVNVPWKDKVKAIIFSGFPGAESGNAIADIIFGKENPSGHLPFVWGELKDYPPSTNYPLENLTVVNKTSGETYKDVYRYD
jgi:beta-glucosidase